MTVAFCEKTVLTNIFEMTDAEKYAEIIKNNDEKIKELAARIEEKKKDLVRLEDENKQEISKLQKEAKKLKKDIEKKEKFIAKRKEDYEKTNHGNYKEPQKVKDERLINTVIMDFPSGSKVQIDYGDYVVKEID
ncbi:hypothetical protein GPJ56_004817 [Histomonas meleagridis]|uniref:uncharacterized protein n=1 Tax=Histomonas meleagridis TaxID=135588 RepID=UPI003559D741|nr:hypothetical protein GPJ56_004817 [Histomonas meleagridis]KAH0803468.1 hypothetical protein GO595_003812 [Histomonas meleagridis]